MLTRQIRIQIVVFAAIAVVVIASVFFGYLKVQSTVLGLGRYTITMQLTEAAGLYEGGNVSYRGVEVGRVRDVRLTETGAEAVLQLDSGFVIPATDLNAEVHSVSAIGEQYVALTPRSTTGPNLKDGDVIPVDRTHVLPDINSLVAAANRGLRAIPRDNLKTVINEGYAAVGGLGPELSRLLTGMTNLAIDARKNLDALTTLIDDSKPVLDSQIDSSDAVRAWAANLAGITGQLQTNDTAVQGIIQKGAPAADESRQLLDRLRPALPVILANLGRVADVGVDYHASIETLLTIVPATMAYGQATVMPEQNIKSSYPGLNLSFNLNMNLPPACTTGYLPPEQIRSPSYEDHPDRIDGDLYCRIPQDAPINVRGARNYPCETRPGKRAPTVAMCESDEEYVPLNEGWNWKGNPNSTYTDQDVPQLPPGQRPPAAAPPSVPPDPIAVAEYNPATGTYFGADGEEYRHIGLVRTSDQEPTWQQMLMPPEVR